MRVCLNARCMCVCVCVWATRFACGREQSLPRAWDSQATHLAINPHAQCSAMDPRAASPRCNSSQAQHRADRCHALCEQCQRNHNRKNSATPPTRIATSARPYNSANLHSPTEFTLARTHLIIHLRRECIHGGLNTSPRCAVGQKPTQPAHEETRNAPRAAL